MISRAIRRIRWEAHLASLRWHVDGRETQLGLIEMVGRIFPLAGTAMNDYCSFHMNLRYRIVSHDEKWARIIDSGMPFAIILTE